MGDRIYLFDTTLRDGEQTPGVNLNEKEKVEIALQLERFGIDVIEAGFAAASPGDSKAVRAVAKAVSKSMVVALARANNDDIDAVVKSIGDIDNTGIHVFLATSPIHREKKLFMNKEQVLKTAVESVRYAAKHFDYIEFSCEDATRTEWDFLKDVAEAVIKEGAKTLNFPDTVGYSTPKEYGDLFRYLQENVKGIENVRLSCHCHDDLGLAVANSIAAVEAGVRQVEGCINGIGERAGNAALEEVAALLATRKDFYKKETGIQLNETARTSRIVSKLTGLEVPANKAVIGANAFAHSSGIHQDGVIKDKTTYEIMRPETMGVGKSTLILGKLSGRHALKEKLEELGYSVSDEELFSIFRKFKELSDHKKDIHDEDIIALVESDKYGKKEPYYTFKNMKLEYFDENTYEASIELNTHEGSTVEATSSGNGPVDALYKAIEKVSDENTKLVEYKIQSVTQGEDSQGEVYVRLQNGEETVLGRGLSLDIIKASAFAYIDALNRLKEISFRKQSKMAQG